MSEYTYMFATSLIVKLMFFHKYILRGTVIWKNSNYLSATRSKTINFETYFYFEKNKRNSFFLGKNVLVLLLFRIILNTSSANVWISSLWFQTCDPQKLQYSDQETYIQKYILLSYYTFMKIKVPGSDKSPWFEAEWKFTIKLGL